VTRAGWAWSGCAVPAASAWAQSQGNDAFAAWLLGTINALAAADQPARKDLLEANRSYRINVSWQWQGLGPRATASRSRGRRAAGG